MQINHIHVENYKTYLMLDLDVSVKDEERPIILIGGMNGSGKTTLFDAIYGALYGLEIRDERHFRELFNSGVTDIIGKRIVLEIDFEGMIGSKTAQYKLTRTYQIVNAKAVENVTLHIGGTTYTYGTRTAQKDRTINEEAVKKIIKANLPKELSNYFLFDAMKTSELVKDEQINQLIRDNIKSVMGFNKYSLLVNVSSKMLDEMKAGRIENENLKKEFQELQERKRNIEGELSSLRNSYDDALGYANNNREQYNLLKEGRNKNDITKDQISRTEARINEIRKSEQAFRQNADELTKQLETDIFVQKLASSIKNEVEQILNHKLSLEESKKSILSEKQIENIAGRVVAIIQKRYVISQTIDLPSIVSAVMYEQEADEIKDRYDYLNNSDVEAIKSLVNSTMMNPYNSFEQSRDRTEEEMKDLPKLQRQLESYRESLAGDDFSMISLYEENERNMTSLKEQIREKETEITRIEKEIGRYDFDIPNVPDPKFELMKQLPDFFRKLQHKLLMNRKRDIENMMKEQLNINLVSYSGTIERVELSDSDDNISFKMYHKQGNEIPLNQLNAGAKQTVMQVLLKVLYELGDYEPPVMIDTVMGVLDKESRATIIENYFPNLARQTILLSTDSEIRTGDDYKLLEAYISKVYTVHRDKEHQCTTVSDDYFGETLKD
ncbi:MAG: DNA sulfur modification protein DndD [Prevotella sp.]|nr:DNA sulfur modification protein DndD [Prevotella sp.]